MLTTWPRGVVSLPCEPQLMEEKTPDPGTHERAAQLFHSLTGQILSLGKLNKATETAIRWWGVLNRAVSRRVYGCQISLGKQVSAQKSTLEREEVERTALERTSYHVAQSGREREAPHLPRTPFLREVP